MKLGEHPVRHFIGDNATSIRWCGLEGSPGPPWPPDRDWSGWEARYDNDCERGKRTSRDFADFPDDIRWLFRHLTDPCWEAVIAEMFGFDYNAFEHDPQYHGGGIHVTEPGGWLNCHLDYDRHPIVPGKRRAVNAIVFLHERWEPEWGGQFYLADPKGNPIVIIDPLPGRAILFETNDLSYHGVLPVTGSEERVSVAVYYLVPANTNHVRERALFLPKRSKA